MVYIHNYKVINISKTHLNHMSQLHIDDILWFKTRYIQAVEIRDYTNFMTLLNLSGIVNFSAMKSINSIPE